MTGEKTYVSLVADLSGYTALTEAHGSRWAARVIQRYQELVVVDHRAGGGRLAETKGDEVLVVGEDAIAVAKTALVLVRRVQ